MMAFLLLFCSPGPSKEPTETQKGPGGESLASGNDSAWDPESRNSEWFLFKVGLGPVAGGEARPGCQGASLAAAPSRGQGGLSGKWANRATWKISISQLSGFPGGGIIWLGVIAANSSFQIWLSGPGKLGPCLILFLEVICSFFDVLFSISQRETSHKIISVSPSQPLKHVIWGRYCI